MNGSARLDRGLEGEEITSVVPRLLAKLPDVVSVRLHVLRMIPSSETRVVDLPQVKPIVKEALRLREEYRVPFWEAILLLARRGDTDALGAILDSAGHHQPMRKVATTMDVEIDSFSVTALRDIISTLREDEVLVLSSAVVLRERSERAHIPMLDFRIRPNHENEELAVQVLERIGVSGTLFNSGNSYHFYGHNLLANTSALIRFLGIASLFAPYVDQRWIGHQLIEGACALRVSPGKSFRRPPIAVRQILLG